MKLFSLWIACVVLFLAAGSNLVILASQSPVLNPLMRDEALISDWRTGATLTLFERGAYYRSRAITYLSLIEGTADIDLVDKAQELARKAVEDAPADAFAWSLLAWAEMLRGEDEAARRALERSWALAPYSTALASDRLILADALGLVAPGNPRETELALLRDALRLQQASPGFFNQLREDHPDIDVMMEVLPRGS